MNLFDIPGLSGYKTALAGWALLILGLGAFLVSVGHCIQTPELSKCFAEISAAWQDLVAAAAGLGVLGIGHKLTKKDSL